MFLNWYTSWSRLDVHSGPVRITGPSVLWQYWQISAEWECFDGRYWTVLLHIPTVDVTKAIFFRYTELETHLYNVFFCKWCDLRWVGLQPQQVCDYSKGIIHTKIKIGSLATHHYIKGGVGITQNTSGSSRGKQLKPKPNKILKV